MIPLDPAMANFWYWFFQVVLVIGAFGVVGLIFCGIWQIIRFMMLD